MKSDSGGIFFFFFFSKYGILVQRAKGKSLGSLNGSLSDLNRSFFKCHLSTEHYDKQCTALDKQNRLWQSIWAPKMVSRER